MVTGREYTPCSQLICYKTRVHVRRSIRRRIQLDSTVGIGDIGVDKPFTPKLHDLALASLPPGLGRTGPVQRMLQEGDNMTRDANLRKTAL